MQGRVRIENERGLNISRFYNSRRNREEIVGKLVKRYRLTNYTITIIPDVKETNGQDIELHRSGTIHRAYCAPCVGF